MIIIKAFAFSIAMDCKHKRKTQAKMPIWQATLQVMNFNILINNLFFSREGKIMCSYIVSCFLGLKGDVALEEAERRRSIVLNLRSLQMQEIPQKLAERNKTFEKRVERLFLQNNLLSSLPAYWGTLLPHLYFLALDYNEFKRLPDTLAFMTQLTFLNISHNDFSEVFFSIA